MLIVRPHRMHQVLLPVLAGVITAIACTSPADIPPVAVVQVSPGLDTVTALGEARQFSAAVKDANGNAIAGKTITWQSSATSVATVDPTTGMATAVANGATSITATADNVTGHSDFVVVQKATKLAFTVQPTSAIVGGTISPAVQVQIQDARGNRITTAQNAVTLAIGTNPSGGVLSGTKTVNAVAGTATFPGLSLDKAGNGYTVVASATDLTSATSATFNITTVASVATKLTFYVQPTSATAGQTLSPAVQVEIQDASGARVTTATNQVTLAIGTNPSGGTLAGTKVVNAVAGVATFSNLSINNAGTGYTLVASATGLTASASAAFNIVAPAAAKLGFYVQPTTAAAGSAFSPAVQVEIQDASGARVTSATNPVTLAIETNPSGGMLAGTKIVNAVNGVATFSNLSINNVGNGYALGAIATGLTSKTSAPFNITSATAVSFVRVDASYTVTCGVTAAGAAYCWGDNTYGQIGDGTTTSRLHPRLVSGGLTWATVNPGYFHTCGVTTAHIGYCWGNSAQGQVGNGDYSTQLSPTQVAGSISFDSVWAGDSHSCGLTSAGAVYCWGFNQHGQLGDGTTTDQWSPVLVTGGHTFASVRPGRGHHTCGVTTMGDAYCWGENGAGQLGNGNTTSSSTPVLVGGSHTFVSVTPGFLQTCGVTTGGAAYCWGGNADGQLGDGTTTDRLAPALVAGSHSFAVLSAGSDHTCGIAAGTAYCWGSNGWGQLGVASANDGRIPGVVTGGLSFVMLNAGFFYTCGTTTVGTYCWGHNHAGELGDGTTTDRSSPTAVVP